MEDVKKVLREKLVRMTRTLVAQCEQEAQAAESRLETARRLRAQLLEGKDAGACNVPRADFSNTLSNTTARVDALLQLLTDLEDGVTA